MSVLDRNRALPAAPLVEKMRQTRKWPKAHSAQLGQISLSLLFFPLFFLLFYSSKFPTARVKKMNRGVKPLKQNFGKITGVKNVIQQYFEIFQIFVKSLDNNFGYKSRWLNMWVWAISRWIITPTIRPKIWNFYQVGMNLIFSRILKNKNVWKQILCSGAIFLDFLK